jgi:hypothetical protein
MWTILVACEPRKFSKAMQSTIAFLTKCWQYPIHGLILLEF